MAKVEIVNVGPIAQQAMAKVEIVNVGPIAQQTIIICKGVTVLRGSNGSGKSHALAATEALVKGSGKLPLRDGYAKGEVTGWDARISVAKSTRRTGAVDVTTLEGRFAIDDLVDPGFKDADVADSARIKALLGLTGANANLEAFAEITDTETFADIVTDESRNKSDPCGMAASIKRDFEAAARKVEEGAQRAESCAAACREAAADIDIEVTTDAVQLTESQKQAHCDLAVLLDKRIEVGERRESRDDAARRIEDAMAEYDGPSYQDAKSDAEDAEGHLTKSLDELQSAKDAVVLAESRVAIAGRVTSAASHHETLMESLAETANSITGTNPTNAEIESASVRVKAAESSVEKGVLARRAINELANRDEHLRAAELLRTKSESLRLSAAITDEVLSDAVASDTLQVREGRLVLEYNERGTIFFSELSAGERWKIALDISAENVGDGGLIVVAQEAWEALDPVNKTDVHKHAIELGVCILTAEASEGDLRSEPYKE